MNTFSDPEKIIEQVTLLPGQKVADLGAGNGAYARALAKKVLVGNTGAVYAVDIKKNMLEKIAQDAQEAGFENLHVVWGDIEEPLGTRLRENSIELVLIANTLFQVGSKKNLIDEAHRILTPAGTLVVVDWSESFGNIGPKPDHVVTESAAKKLCENNGFVFDRDLQAGEHHYGFVARKM